MLGWLSGRGRDARTFYAARAARILPSYLLCVLGLFFFVALPQGQYGTPRHLWTDLLGHLSFTHNLFPESYAQTRLNGALWTLAVEVQFYLIAPLLCRAFRKQPAAVYGGMLLVTQIYRRFVVLPMEDTTYFLNRLPNLLEVYANGMLAAHLYGLLCRKPQKWWDAALSTLLAAGALCMLWRMMEAQGHLSGYETIRLGQMERRFLFSALGGIFLAGGSRAVSGFRWLCSNRAVRFLSGISLNFYIWHQVLAVKLKTWRIPAYISDAPQQAGEQPWQTQYTLLCFLAAFAAGTLVTYLIERPCARWMNRRTCAKPRI